MIPVGGIGREVASCRVQVAGYRVQVSGYRVQVAKEKLTAEESLIVDYD